jgi:hypothetical protein
VTKKYGLTFISDDNIFNHVKETVKKYRFDINLQEFNKNIVDPIKLTFDTGVYGKSIQDIIDSEIIRQIDKSNTNHIGYFHQNIFQYFDGWDVPNQGFDVINAEKNIYVEIKNKHNTMNSASSQKTYMKMQNKILRDDSSTCYLAEVIAKHSQNIPWQISLDGEKITNKNIRKISMDKFYALVTGDDYAFKRLCEVLPQILNEVITEIGSGHIQSTVFDSLIELSPNILQSLYLLSFREYEGFNAFRFRP